MKIQSILFFIVAAFFSNISYSAEKEVTKRHIFADYAEYVVKKENVLKYPHTPANICNTKEDLEHCTFVAVEKKGIVRIYAFDYNSTSLGRLHSWVSFLRPAEYNHVAINPTSDNVSIVAINGPSVSYKYTKTEVSSRLADEKQLLAVNGYKNLFDAFGDHYTVKQFVAAHISNSELLSKKDPKEIARRILAEINISSEKQKTYIMSEKCRRMRLLSKIDLEKTFENNEDSQARVGAYAPTLLNYKKYMIK
jgi:hypothetical protein